MSHFTVLVIGEDVDKQLAPFQENNYRTCPEEFLKFKDTTEEMEKEYNDPTETTSAVNINGKYVSAYCNEAVNLLKQGLVKEEEVPIKTVYPTFEIYADKYHNAKIDKKTGRYGYWENPNAKWDWYLVGGRWTGFFKMKQDKSGVVGEPGLMTSEPAIGYADSALKGDIDFDGMRNEKCQKAAELFDEITSIIKPHLENYKSWEYVRDVMFKDDIKSARKFYHDQDVIKALNKSSKYFCDVEEFMCTREKYLEDARNEAILTFAVILNGKWYERGEMGWWGVVTNEKDKKEWAKKFMEMLESLSDDTKLTVVDCHI